MTQVFELPDTLDVPASRGVGTIMLTLETISSETVAALVRFALQSRISNAFAGMKDATDDELSDEAHRHIAEAEANELRFGAGGGFTAKTPEELGIRDTIESYARKNLGLKAADAKKVKMTPYAFYIDYAAYLNKKQGRDDVTPDKVAEAILKAAQPLIEQYRAKQNPTELSI